ncbi:protein translocase subunit SecD [Cellvibrio japonicus]|uniref:Protein translocase subunit SecD n=1 Tax=Cellvibrio japonicus (strain Ueda107) TaxID=498211 RepID=B3PDJ8_CELJU|nr:protein translocase subunit SecD [Cellvibrio japonicus]ACE83450.1 protein-export membrane protein SecD [Cellvibrio japonicus Ueda107]QEI12013.1 protein translocase subunit SecD [Cellvibrio japonicus]QEI15588.1 protein translocase subunit SecD [Cellvibrio japonicus]QEI19166.1 protein translocase subunit SecD [Cellvibrio japonicus]
MLNRYPLWKYLVLLFLLLIGTVYAIPNLYIPDPAVQVSGDSSAKVIDQPVLEAMEAALKKADIEYFGAEADGKTALVRLLNNDQQMVARTVIQRALGDGYVVALNKASTTPGWLQALGAEPMKLGLDLAGGVHFLLEVDTASAVAKRQEISADEMKDKLRKEKIRYASVDTDRDNRIVGRFRSADTRDQAINSLRRDHPNQLFTRVDNGESNFSFVASLSETAVRTIESEAVSQNLITLRNRVNELGVSEPIVQSQGRSRIIVQLPGIQDPAEAKRVIGKTANLEFRLGASPDTPITNREEFPYKDEIMQMQRGNAVLERQIIVTGDHVANAQSSFDPESNQPQVNITLDGLGGEKMHRITRNNVGRQMGILFIEYKNRTEITRNAQGEEVHRNIQYVEKKVISLATIQSALGVQFRITGLDKPGEASELALLLRAGALAAPMHFVEERTIGPSLGAQNIRNGVDATIWGMILVVIFMLIAYRVFGVFANLALTMNVLLMIAVMSMFGATLTLPGIAGIVLSIGMAVDANVLIHSRIREELKGGASPQQAIYAGYERAWITILDANLTTLIVGIILFAIGTGPVKGFAVTLMIGIATSMYTSVTCSRALANLVYGSRKNLKKISI